MVKSITAIPGTFYGTRLKQLAEDYFKLEIYKTGRKIKEIDFQNLDHLKRIIQRELELLDQLIPEIRLKIYAKEILGNLEIVENAYQTQDLVDTTVKNVLETGTSSVSKIVIAGLDGAGKTAIFHTVFRKENPLSLVTRPTEGLKTRKFRSKFWECSIVELGGGVECRVQYCSMPPEDLFQDAGILIFVVDSLDMARYKEAIEYFKWNLQEFSTANPKGQIYVFVHKIDKSFFSPLEKVKRDFGKIANGMEIDFFATSIFDQSLSLALSVIFTRIFPKSTLLNTILKNLSRHPLIDYAMVLLRRTGLICASSIAPSESHEEDAMNEAGLIFLKAAEDVTSLFFKNKKEHVAKLVLETPSERLLIKAIDKDALLLVKFSGDISRYGDEDRGLIRNAIPQIQDALKQF